MKVAMKPSTMNDAATMPQPSWYLRPNIFGNQ